MLCGGSRSSRIMYSGIKSEFDVVRIIIETKSAAGKLIRRRIKNLGIVKVFGQLAFLAFNKILSKTSRARIGQLMHGYDLDDAALPNDLLEEVDSINDKRVISLLEEMKPDAVVVNGTRIISKAVLSSVDCPFINTHMGITPRYRGVHGGYWALANGDRDNCGVTVHLVDRGIDTGGVLYQDTIHVEPADNFNTYPIHQIAKAIPLMKAALNDVRQGKLNTKQGVLPSHLYYHPTLFEYLKYRISRGAK